MKEWIGTLKDTSIEMVMKKMKFPENVVVKKGFIPNTIKGITERFC